MELVLLIVIVVLLLVAGVGFFLFRRHYQQQLKLAMRRAQKSEQLKAVFIDNACHTLRTPLNAISGYTTMILETPDTMMQPDHVRELAGNIEKDSKQLLGFVDQLVELSKFEGITPSFTFIEVNLTELMASYRREALNYTKPDVSVQVRTDLSPHCKGTLDTNFMHQLMMHLLKNAAMSCRRRMPWRMSTSRQHSDWPPVRPLSKSSVVSSIWRQRPTQRPLPPSGSPVRCETVAKMFI